jgi:hypothetical protein
MKTNDKGSRKPNQDINSELGSNQPGRENPEKNDPTWKEPGNPDHTEPGPDKNDPTRIDPDWNDPDKEDPTRPENINQPGTGKSSPASDQELGTNKNYTGDSYSAKDRSGEKNYTGTSAGFMGDVENHEDEPGDNEEEK